MWLFILATYYYYCQDLSVKTTCYHNPPTGPIDRTMRLGNETQGSKIYYLCLSKCIYYKDNFHVTSAYRYIFQGFGVYDENIQAEGLLCLSQKSECIWNYSMRTPQLTRTVQPTNQLKVQSTRNKKPKIPLAIFYQIILFE